MQDRRLFVTGLSAGFAAAVQPIAAQTAIHTSADGLVAGEVRIPSGGVEIPAYRAMPKTAGSHPVVLVVQEIFGVHEHIKDVCRRFARLGHFAIAPEMYARQGDVAGLKSIQEILPLVSKVPDAQVMADLDAAVEWAGKNGGDTTKLALTGFCWGGRVAWLYAAHSARLKASVAWYGRLVGPTDALHPKNAIDVAADLKAPVLGLYGGKDQGIPPASVEQMREALKRAGKKSEIVVYPEAGHGFHADYRPSYDKAAAEDGWKRLQAWLRTHGAK